MKIKICSRPVQSTLMLVEDILEELGKQLSSCSNLVPLTYGQLNKALGKDIRPILREFLMDSTQTVENTVRELVQLSNNQFILSRTPDTTFLLVALRNPIVWKTVIFDWLAERRMYFSAAMPVATMEEPQDEDLQITSYDDGSICKTERERLIAAMPVARMEEPQDVDPQITSHDDGLSICKTERERLQRERDNDIDMTSQMEMMANFEANF